MRLQVLVTLLLPRNLGGWRWRDPLIFGDLVSSSITCPLATLSIIQPLESGSSRQRGSPRNWQISSISCSYSSLKSGWAQRRSIVLKTTYFSKDLGGRSTSRWSWKVLSHRTRWISRRIWLRNSTIDKVTLRHMVMDMVCWVWCCLWTLERCVC